MLQSTRELLQATVALYRKEFWLFLGYTAWLLVPVATFYFASSLPPNPVTTVLIIVTVVLQLFVWLWIMVCLMKATGLIFEQKPVDPHTLSTVSLRRIQPLLGVVFLQALIYLGGFLLLVIPFIIFWVWYSLAQVATGLSDKQALESLTVSRSLVVGRFWIVCWQLIAGPVVIGLLYAFVSGLILFALSGLLGADLDVIFSDTPPLWASLIQSITDIFFIPLFIIYAVLLYLNLTANPLEKTSPVT